MTDEKIKENKDTKSGPAENVTRDIKSLPQAKNITNKIDRIEWSSFNLGDKFNGASMHDPCLIEVLVGDPVIEDNPNNTAEWTQNLLNGFRKVNTAQEDQNAGTVSTTLEQKQLPERIRIRSLALLKILSQILGPEGSVLREVRGQRMVFL